MSKIYINIGNQSCQEVSYERYLIHIHHKSLNTNAHTGAHTPIDTHTPTHPHIYTLIYNMYLDINMYIYVYILRVPRYM